MMLNLQGLGTVAIADPASEYTRQLALGMPNPNWYRDWLLTLDLPAQSLAWFTANPSFANPDVWEKAGILSQWAGSPAAAYRSGSRPTQSSSTSATSSVRASFSFSNDTSGNRSLLKVGDRWTLSVTGAPNSDVVIVGGPGGRSDRNVVGRTNAAGAWSTSGSSGVAEIGNWVQHISVGGVSAGTLSFQVVAAPSASTPSSTVQAEVKTTAEKLADQVQSAALTTGAMEWAKENTLLLVGGAAAVLFLMRGSK